MILLRFIKLQNLWLQLYWNEIAQILTVWFLSLSSDLNSFPDDARNQRRRVLLHPLHLTRQQSSCAIKYKQFWGFQLETYTFQFELIGIVFLFDIFPFAQLKMYLYHFLTIHTRNYLSSFDQTAVILCNKVRTFVEFSAVKFNYDAKNLLKTVQARDAKDFSPHITWLSFTGTLFYVCAFHMYINAK